MKRMILFAIAMCIGLVSFAQNYKNIFLGKDAYAYKGVYLKYKDKLILTPSYSFYEKKPTKAFQLPVYKRTEKYEFITDTTKLTNREFLVVNVEPFIPKIKISRNRDTFDYVFEMNDGKETLYYVYDGEYDFNFPFLVKGFEYTTNYANKFINKRFDEFEEKTTYITPILDDMVLSKHIKDNDVKYYLSLYTIGSTLNYGGKGVFVIFEDGTKWVKESEEIDVENIKGSNWGYKAFIPLNQKDLEIFSNKVVKKFRLYIYDNESPKNNQLFPYLVQSIIKMF